MVVSQKSSLWHNHDNTKPDESESYPMIISLNIVGDWLSIAGKSWVNGGPDKTEFTVNQTQSVIKLWGGEDHSQFHLNHHPPTKMSGVREFSYGLCGCLGDFRLCCMSFWCPCFQVGKNAAYFGEDQNTACLMHACFGCPYELLVRNRLRQLRGIEGSMTKDLLLGLMCGFCVLVQDAREIEESKKSGLASGVVTINVMTSEVKMERE